MASFALSSNKVVPLTGEKDLVVQEATEGPPKDETKETKTTRMSRGSLEELSERVQSSRGFGDKGNRVHVGWFVAGGALGTLCATIAYGTFPMGHPLRNRAWWRCMAPCATLWIWLLVVTGATNYHFLVLRAVNRQARYPFRCTAVMCFVGTIAVFTTWTVTFYIRGYYPAEFHGAIVAVVGGGFAIASGRWLFVLPPEGTSNYSKEDAENDRKWVVGFNLLLVIVCVMHWIVAIIVFRAVTYSIVLATVLGASFGFARILSLHLGHVVLDRIRASAFHTCGPTLLAVQMTGVQASFVTAVMGNMPLAVATTIAIFDGAITLAAVPHIVGAIHDPLHVWLWSWVRHWGRPPNKKTEIRDRDDLLRSTELLDLAASELVEVVMPVFYAVTILILREGPNSDWLVGVGVAAYGQRLRPIPKLLTNTAVRSLTDILVLGATTFGINRSLGIDLADIAAFVGRRWRLPIMLVTAFLLYHQICILSIHCGINFAFQSRAKVARDIDSS